MAIWISCIGSRVLLVSLIPHPTNSVILIPTPHPTPPYPLDDRPLSTHLYILISSVLSLSPRSHVVGTLDLVRQPLLPPTSTMTHHPTLASVDSIPILRSSASTWSFVLLALLALLAWSRQTKCRDSRDGLAILNAPKWFEIKLLKQAHFLVKGIEELARARALSRGRPFRLLTNSREIVVLPPSYAEVLADEDRLSFAKYFADVCAGCTVRFLFPDVSVLIQSSSLFPFIFSVFIGLLWINAS